MISTRDSWRWGLQPGVPHSLLRAARLALVVLAAFAALGSFLALASSQGLKLILQQRMEILARIAVVLGILLLALLERRRERPILCRPVRVAVGVQGTGDRPRPPGWGPDDENEDGACGPWIAPGVGGPLDRPGR